MSRNISDWIVLLFGSLNYLVFILLVLIYLLGDGGGDSPAAAIVYVIMIIFAPLGFYLTTRSNNYKFNIRFFGLSLLANLIGILIMIFVVYVDSLALSL
jgi:uncharacterized membrane protein